jgi:hypothetical protein
MCSVYTSTGERQVSKGKRHERHDTMAAPTSDTVVDGRYVILSVDGHAGATIHDPPRRRRGRLREPRVEKRAVT